MLDDKKKEQLPGVQPPPAQYLLLKRVDILRGRIITTDNLQRFEIILADAAGKYYVTHFCTHQNYVKSLISALNRMVPVRFPEPGPKTPASEEDHALALFPSRKCVMCGCTDERACEGGCAWVDADLCSRCSPLWNTFCRWVEEIKKVSLTKWQWDAFHGLIVDVLLTLNNPARENEIVMIPLLDEFLSHFSEMLDQMPVGGEVIHPQDKDQIVDAVMEMPKGGLVLVKK